MRPVAAAAITALALVAALPLRAADPEVAQLLERAEFWQLRARDDLAREALERALRLAPEEPEALVALGRLQLKGNQEPEASATLERLRRAHPSHPGVAQLSALLRIRGPDSDRLRQARQLARAGRPEEAVGVYRSLFPEGMPSDEFQLEYAQALGATPKGWEDARGMLAALARKHPEDARYRLALASHLAQRKPLSADTLRTLKELAAHPSPAISRPAVSAWRRALVMMEAAHENVPALREYIAANPGETAVRDRLDQMLKDLAEGKGRPDPAAVARQAGWTAFSAGKLEEAEAHWRESLAKGPASGEANGGIGLVRMRQGRHAEALEHFERAARMEPASRAKWEELARTARYWLLLQQARAARDAKRLDEARTLAEEARVLDPKEPSSAMELVRIHLAAGRDRDAEALVAEISEGDRAGVRRSIDTMRADRLRERARQARAQDRLSEAIAALEQAAALEPDDAWVRLDLARTHAAHADPLRGRAVFDELVRRRPNDAEARYAQAIFLSGIDQESDALLALEAIAPAERTANMARLQRSLWVGVQGQRAAALAERGERAEAERTVARAREAAGKDRGLALQVARTLASLEAERDLGDLLDALATMGPATPEQQAEEAALRRSLAVRRARALRNAGKTAAAADVYRDVLRASPDEADVQLSLAETLLERGAHGEARVMLDAALARSPSDSRALGVAAVLAHREGRLDEAITHEQRALATGGDAYRYRRLAEWLDEANSWAWTSVDALHRSGSGGKSRLSAQEMPLAWKQGSRRGGRWFARISPARVSAGTLDMDESYEVSTFGSLLLCQPLCVAPRAQSERGIALAAGYERAGWRVDLGTSPIGFPVVNVLGGVARKGDLGPLGYTLEVSRRPLASSVLSYAGTQDPNSGRTWGGVVATGVRMNVSRDSGGDYGAWGLGGLYRLTGRNVQDNDKAELMGGLYRRVLNEQDRLLTVGVAGMLWRFSANAGEYTFGHGGYYSPGSYRSISLPVAYAFRTQRTSVLLRASVSAAWSQSRGAPFFPTDDALQAQAVALQPTSFVDPFYAAGNNGRSFGRAFGAAVEHQLAPGIFAGARLELERSTNYTPNRFLLYVRFALDGSAARPVSLPPESGMPGYPQ